MVTPNQPGNPEEPSWGQPPGYNPPQYRQVPPGYPTPPGYPGQPPGYPGQPPGYPAQPPGYGAQPPGYSANPPYPSYPANPGYADPEAPFGRDPVTGEPLSDKSAATAGVLQLFLGTFGVGRFYIESTQIAVIQLCLGVFGMLFTIFCLIGLPVLIGVGIWALVDAIMIFSGNVRDNYGRKLR
jgi:TM2 domain-containing membrane protein YozV